MIACYVLFLCDIFVVERLGMCKCAILCWLAVCLILNIKNGSHYGFTLAIVELRFYFPLERK